MDQIGFELFESHDAHPKPEALVMNPSVAGLAPTTANERAVSNGTGKRGVLVITYGGWYCCMCGDGPIGVSVRHKKTPTDETPYRHMYEQRIFIVETDFM